MRHFFFILAIFVNLACLGKPQPTRAVDTQDFYGTVEATADRLCACVKQQVKKSACGDKLACWMQAYDSCIRSGCPDKEAALEAFKNMNEGWAGDHPGELMITLRITGYSPACRTEADKR